MNVQCPMPQLDFEVITLGHGSGGILTNKLLESGVFNLLKNPLLDTHHDGAVFELSGKLAFSTDSYVISPFFFPGGNIGSLAVHGTLNDLAMCGAIPKYLSLSFILEEGLTMKAFWEILVSIKIAAEQAGISIVTGDTKVVEKGKGDGVFINTSGIGQLHPQADISIRRVKSGDKIIVSNTIATHGVAILSVREGLEFETDIVSDTAPLHQVVETVLSRFGPAIHLLRDPTRGGVATVLNEIARDSALGISISQTQIPVLDEVSGACELLGLDPLYVANEGVFMAIVAGEFADELVELLRTFEICSHACVIGEVVEQHPRQVVLTSRIGGRRVVNMLVGEQLPRIC
ncbi:MAG: hydrogenase expression/formation protein HypE [Spirosomataceae bacterium]